MLLQTLGEVERPLELSSRISGINKLINEQRSMNQTVDQPFMNTISYDQRTDPNLYMKPPKSAKNGKK